MTGTLTPVAKNVPEACVCVVSNAPELSSAVGAVHETVVPVLRKGTNMVISSGQKVTTGASLSAKEEKRKVPLKKISTYYKSNNNNSCFSYRPHIHHSLTLKALQHSEFPAKHGTRFK